VAVPGTGANPNGGAHHAEVLAAAQKLGDRRGQNPVANGKALAEQLRLDTGWCWFWGVEALFVIREDGTWGEYHAVAFGDGGWTNNWKGKWMGRHRDSRTTDVGLPYPDPRGLKMELKVHPKGNHTDTTLIVKGALDYCRSVRLGRHGTQPRASCPVRPDGHPDRVAWERLLLGDQLHTCNGEPMEWFRGNPAQARGVCRGTYRTCSEDGTICTEVEL
jgi:hypothetical protein